MTEPPTFRSLVLNTSPSIIKLYHNITPWRADSTLIAHHFENKPGLYLAVMNEIAQEIAAVHVSGPPQDASLADQLRHTLRGHITRCGRLVEVGQRTEGSPIHKPKNARQRVLVRCRASGG